MERTQAINLLLGTVLLTGCAGSVGPTNTPDSPIFNPTPLTETFVPTKTPFQPEILIPTSFLPPTETLVPTPTVEVKIPYLSFGIDFGDSSRQVDIQISLSNGKVFNVNSTPVICETIDTYHSVFAPGKHNTCAYQPRSNSEDIFLFGHSGWLHEPKPDGGTNYIKMETEDIRHWLEDFGGYTPDRRLPLEQIQRNINDFVGANIEITQGENTATDLKVLAVVRVPPDKLGPFGSDSDLSNEDIMTTLAIIDPSVAQYANDGKPQIIIIFCGWHNVEEDNINHNPNANYYAWSRYAIILGK
jgi:hypothetical protein